MNRVSKFRRDEQQLNWSKAIDEQLCKISFKIFKCTGIEVQYNFQTF